MIFVNYSQTFQLNIEVFLFVVKAGDMYFLVPIKTLQALTFLGDVAFFIDWRRSIFFFLSFFLFHLIFSLFSFDFVFILFFFIF